MSLLKSTKRTVIDTGMCEWQCILSVNQIIFIQYSYTIFAIHITLYWFRAASKKCTLLSLGIDVELLFSITIYSYADSSLLDGIHGIFASTYMSYWICLRTLLQSQWCTECNCFDGLEISLKIPYVLISDTILWVFMIIIHSNYCTTLSDVVVFFPFCFIVHWFV